MGHNVSRQQQDQIAADRRREQRKPLLAAGWTLTWDARFVPIPTAAGYRDRRQNYALRCDRAGCRRRYAFDFEAVVRAGYGERPVAELAHRLRCDHWDGCRLAVIDQTYPGGVPLLCLAQEGGTLVVVVCRGCGRRSPIAPEAAAERLKRLGLGDGGTGYLYMAGLVRGPCKACGGRAFTAELDRAPAFGTPNYRGPK